MNEWGAWSVALGFLFGDALRKIDMGSVKISSEPEVYVTQQLHAGNRALITIEFFVEVK